MLRQTTQACSCSARCLKDTEGSWEASGAAALGRKKLQQGTKTKGWTPSEASQALSAWQAHSFPPLRTNLGCWPWLQGASASSACCSSSAALTAKGGPESGI